ncbi:MAG: nucleotidyl transferase AbiEii/AbiGii toxin family protein [Caulobacterales bacterium]|nr:nucleotidyl transferase AbiEii/AbiGii toxin family protein [Caulobacterales bacterium]MCA0373649.1 nucleotidyl transferase AbiEii/AbiGii toxin family protein [Pseudomonadota bacterium]
MPDNGFLHNHSEFSDLIRIVSEEMGIDPALVEKDYWIMHCLYGLQTMGLKFELKGGTSLSKGLGLIHRFSEDIDIRIEPPAALEVKTWRNHDKEPHIQSRKNFYDWLASEIKIDGIESVIRDIEFDDEKYRSGGIRLIYKSTTNQIAGLKDGILLELGFDDITPNSPRTISSWAYDFAEDKVDIIDNRAKGVACYHAGYTLVEKLQAISTKFRKQQEDATMPKNFMRHYYDVYCLLQDKDVLSFIGTDEYKAHKERRFPKADNQNIAENEAFILSEEATFKLYEAAYNSTSALYYREQPNLKIIIGELRQLSARL